MLNPRLLFAIVTFLACISATIFVFEHFLQEQQNDKTLSGESQLSDKKSGDSEFFYQVIGNIPEFSQKNQIASNANDQFQDKFTLEVDVSPTQGEAELLLDTLRKDGVVAYYTPIQMGDKVVYRVRKGVFANKKLAAAAQSNMASKHGIKSKIVKLR